MTHAEIVYCPDCGCHYSHGSCPTHGALGLVKGILGQQAKEKEKKK